ncbi:hypothetical protein BpHYR1_000011 [Brachionus plicatilis]|uniref:Uncharacterized protein n=1 Tax=Brachionus plicatilis TaxID=10195 RepID=A0A3M7RXE1_BRAPC|nr:hypothetical protein BpHYR1_000011 [Brachionus plicatilis]
MKNQLNNHLTHAAYSCCEHRFKILLADLFIFTNCFSSKIGRKFWKKRNEVCILSSSRASGHNKITRILLILREIAKLKAKDLDAVCQWIEVWWDCVLTNVKVVPHWNKLPENVVKSNSMESAATAPHCQLAVMDSDNLHVRCRSKNYYYYYYYY